MKPGRSRQAFELRSGNLGVDLMMAVARGQACPPLEQRIADLDFLAEIGCASVEDYVGWWPLEPEKGRVVADPYREHAREVRRRGMSYAVYPWVHVLPPWALRQPGFLAARCLEHDRPTYSPSIFSPFTRRAYSRVYRALRAALGREIAAVHLAGPADYGEVGYPTGMASWVVPYPEALDHHHVGLWCGDSRARRHFTRWVSRRYASRRAVEAAWGMEVSPQGFIPFPGPSAKAAGRRDFQRWYTGCMTGFFRWLVRMARDVFGCRPLELRLGHGTELLAFGQDVEDLVRLCRDLDVGLRSTQASVGYLQQKRLATPCRFFGVPLISEPMVERTRPELAERIFRDASCGVRVLFEYPEHLRERDLYVSLLDLLQGDRARVDVALFFPTSEHRIRPTQGLPPLLADSAEVLRDLFDYDVLDEMTILAGALDRYRVLLLLDGGVIDPRAAARIRRWVEEGGALMVGGTTLLSEMSGSTRADGELVGGLRSREGRPRTTLRGEPEPIMRVCLGGGRDRYHLTGCWHGPESAHHFWGGAGDERRCRWTGRRGGVLFPVRQGVDYLLEVDVAAAGPSGRHGEVHLNGRPFAEVPERSAGLCSWRLPAQRLGAGMVAEIALVSETFCPSESGESPDVRSLGLVVREVRLRESETPPDTALPDDPPLFWACVDRSDLREHWMRRLDQGVVVVCPTREVPVLVAVANELVHHLSALTGSGRDAPRLDGRLDGVLTTLFDRRILLVNPTRRLRLKRIPLAPDRTIEVRVPAHGIVEVDRASGSLRTIQAR